jgi:hypothetical protein
VVLKGDSGAATDEDDTDVTEEADEKEKGWW